MDVYRRNLSRSHIPIPQNVKDDERTRPRRRRRGGRNLLDMSRGGAAVGARPYTLYVLWDDYAQGVSLAIHEERVRQELPHVQSSIPIG